MRLYYFTSDKWGKVAITDRRLKVSFPDDVNDLFEFMPFDFGDNRSGKELRRKWKNAISSFSERQGFVSFTEGWSCPTMWAHYADSHKGICLGFDVALGSVDGAFVEKINYVEKLRMVNPGMIANDTYRDEMVSYAKKTKSQHWQYEEEWRAWISLGPTEVIAKAKAKRGSRKAIFYLDFSTEFSLREVILGHKSKLSSSVLRRLLKSSDNVQFVTARPSFRNFAMVQQRDPGLQK